MWARAGAARRGLCSVGARTELFSRLEGHARERRTAIISLEGVEHSYADLLRSALHTSRRLRHEGLACGDRAGLLASPGFEFCSSLLGIWHAGGVAVPLCVAHPPAELAHSLAEADCSLALGSGARAQALAEVASSQGRRFVELVHASNPPPDAPAAPVDAPSDDALIIFTSGTTGAPKGVVLTHDNLRAQASMLVDAWAWRPSDRILHILPLHHLHGLGNKLLCALWAGASVAFSPPAPTEVWRRRRHHDH